MFLDKLFGQSNKAEVQKLENQLREANKAIDWQRKRAEHAEEDVQQYQKDLQQVRAALKSEQDSLCRLEDEAKALAKVLKDTQEELASIREDNQDAQEWMEYYGEAVVRLRERIWEMTILGVQAQLDPKEIANLKHNFDVMTENLLEVGPPGPVWLFPPVKQATEPLCEDDFLAELARQSGEMAEGALRAAEEALDKEREKFRKSCEPSGDSEGLICGQDVPDPPSHWMGDRGPDSTLDDEPLWRKIDYEKWHREREAEKEG